MRSFLFAKKIFLFQFHVNLEDYILGSQIHVNIIDFNCYCHWFKTAFVGKQVVLHPLPPLLQASARHCISHLTYITPHLLLKIVKIW